MIYNTSYVDDEYRYICIGNGWTIRVIASIFRNIFFDK